MGLLLIMKQIYTHFKHIHKYDKKLNKYIKLIFKKFLYNSLNAQWLSRKQINEIERKKTTINKFCNFFNYYN